MLAARFGDDFVNKIQDNLEIKAHEGNRKDNRKRRDQKDKPKKEKERKQEGEEKPREEGAEKEKEKERPKREQRRRGNRDGQWLCFIDLHIIHYLIWKVYQFSTL